MKPSRKIPIMIALVCASVSGFGSRSMTKTVSSGETKSGIRYVPSSQQLELPQPIRNKVLIKKTAKNTNKKNRTKSKDKATEEFRWLNWIYKQWRPKKAGELTEEVLKQMVPAISRWGRRKTKQAAERAEELLNRIIEENLAGNNLAELSVSMFNQAMDAHAKVGNPAGVQRILRGMEELRANHEHLAHLKPDVFSMSTLVTAWAKSRSPYAAERTESILKYMEVQNLAPNTITYNAALNALAMGRRMDKAIRAEDLIQKMKNRHEEGGDCKPDIYSYQSLIKAWSKTKLPGSPQKAEQILKFLDEEAEKGNKALSPNVYCFTTTIHAWAKSTEQDRARNAYQILNHMTQRYWQDPRGNQRVKPNVVTYTAVLNACAFPLDHEKEDAFRIAQLTLAEISLGTLDKPNFLTYAAFLSVCGSTLDRGERRDKIVRQAFRECVQAGQVAQIVLEKLETAASPSLYTKLVGPFVNHDGDVLVPADWSRAVRGERLEEYEQPADGSHSKPLSNTSIGRLKAVGKFGGESSFYSSGKAGQHLETEGIRWSKRPMGSTS